MKKGNGLFTGLFILIGIVFIFVGILVMTQGNSLKKRCTEETIGTVVEIISRRTDPEDLRPSYFPVIEYKVGDRTITQESNSGEYPSKYEVGDQVVIYYNPDNIQEYIIKEDSNPHFIGIIAIVCGSIATIVGITVLIVFNKNSSGLSIKSN